MERQAKAIARRAIEQVKRNPASRVLILCGKAAHAASLWKWIRGAPGSPSMVGFTTSAETRTAFYEYGGQISIRHCEQPVHYSGGLCITHLWVDEYVPEDHYIAIGSRIRATKEKKFNDPMGIYSYTGFVTMEQFWKQCEKKREQHERQQMGDRP
jgi:hypothetical protein